MKKSQKLSSLFLIRLSLLFVCLIVLISSFTYVVIKNTPKEVSGVAGTVNIGAGTSGAACSSGQIPVSDGTKMVCTNQSSLSVGSATTATSATSATTATTATTANGVAWTNVSSRPTTLSQFTNDSGFVTSGLPSGMVAYFNLTACPSGWTAVSGAAGRTIVGRAANESIGSTIGTALGSLENRSGHTHTGGSHQHLEARTFANMIYANGVYMPANGRWDYSYVYTNMGRCAWCYNDWVVSADTGGTQAAAYVSLWLNNIDGYYRAYTSSAGNVATTGPSTEPFMPYIQYLVCSKN